MIKKFADLFFIIILINIVFCNMALAQIPAAGGSTPSAGTVSLNNPLPNTSPQKLIGTVIKAVLGIVGSLALVMFIYGGFLWMTSAGNAEQVQKGKNVLIWAALGLAVIFSSYALVKFVIEGITNKS